jgi:hypothetical protein
MSSSLPTFLRTHPPIPITRWHYGFFETQYPYVKSSTIVGWLPAFTGPASPRDLRRIRRGLERAKPRRVPASAMGASHEPEMNNLSVNNSGKRAQRVFETQNRRI